MAKRRHWWAGLTDQIEPQKNWKRFERRCYPFKRRRWRQFFSQSHKELEQVSQDGPFVIFDCGCEWCRKNKRPLAKTWLKHSGWRPKWFYVGAVDTFRAAAVEQLQVMGRSKIMWPVVAQHKQVRIQRPVIYDAIESAKAKGHWEHWVIADTGRPFIKIKPIWWTDYQKSVRVMKNLMKMRLMKSCWFLDAGTGQKCLSQA